MSLKAERSRSRHRRIAASDSLSLSLSLRFSNLPVENTIVAKLDLLKSFRSVVHLGFLGMMCVMGTNESLMCVKLRAPSLFTNRVMLWKLTLG